MKVTATQAAEALKEQKGFVTHAAKQLGISRRQLHNIINNYPTVKEALDDAREGMKDIAESKIYDKIEAGDTTMIIFYAKTQMKDRGYVERQEMDVTSGGESLSASLDKLISKAYGNNSD